MLVFEDRFLGMQEKSFNDFRATDDDWFPFHRIWQFKRRGEVVWDREKRINILDQIAANSTKGK